MILYHCADLIWATKIKGTAEALGLAARPVRTVEMLEARLGDTRPTGLVVDLEAPEVALALIGRARAEPGWAGKVVAFGPHVAVEAMAAAKRAGADAVMARGAFNAGMPGVLRDLASGAEVGDLMED
ncbi:MAG: hypothetical protein ACK4WH_01210 [Phycisphaerales bacterium]